MGGLDMFGGGRGPAEEKGDTCEKIIISSIALIKMLKHAKAGVPLEVMGYMLGEYVDEFTTRIKDVFFMPQVGTQVSVEATDPVFQTDMVNMLAQTDRTENVVAWYHSHPGYGPWLSSTDIGTHTDQSQLQKRMIAVVIDPLQSVKGKVVIDAFRLIDKQYLISGEEPRQTTTVFGKLKKPTATQIRYGLNKLYFNMVVDFSKEEYEARMMLNLYKRKWSEEMKVNSFKKHSKKNEDFLKGLGTLTKGYGDWITEENKQGHEEFDVWSVGRINPKRRLADVTNESMDENIKQNFGNMMNLKAFCT